MQHQQRDGQSTRRDVLRGIGGGTAAIGAVTLIPASAAGEETDGGKVAFIYDDSPREDYTKAFPAHQEFDVPGCAAVCPGLMGTSSDWLDPEQLEEMYDAGWEVQSHTLKHRALGEIPVTGDIEEGDTEIEVQSSLHGMFGGDPLLIFDDETETTATSAGRNDTGDQAILELEEPIDESFAAGDGRETWVRYTDEFTEEILEESKSQIEEWGYGPVSAYVHTYNRYDGYVTEVLPEYYDSTPNRHGDPLNPTFDIDPFHCGRVNFEDDKLTESELADILDTVVEEPYFALLYGHSNYETFTQDRIERAIEMCLERDLEVTTFQEILIELDVYEPPEDPHDENGDNGTDDDESESGDDANGNETEQTNGDDRERDDNGTAPTDSSDDSSVIGDLIAAILQFFRSLISWLLP